MPFIWNNKVYQLVPDNSEWDDSEFVIARKLHVQFKVEQVTLSNCHYVTQKLHYGSDSKSCCFLTENFD